MRPDPTWRPSPDPDAGPRRMYLYEPGWTVSVKVGSEREFCYMQAPGQNYYHRLLDGEVFVSNPEERLCLACAQRRGLLSYEPRTLREPVEEGRWIGPEGESDYDIRPVVGPRPPE